jgi:CheY-specific phosphatase CheX
MKSCFSEVLDEIVSRSAEDLWRDCGLTLPRTRAQAIPHIGERHVAGLVTFSGPRIQGSLALVSTFPVVAKTRPTDLDSTSRSSGSAGDRILLRDWVGELTNQLLGRIKNRFCAFGLKFDVAMPIAFSGPALSFAIRKYSKARIFTFGRGNDVIGVAVDISTEPQLASMTPQTDIEQAAREGDVILF